MRGQAAHIAIGGVTSVIIENTVAVIHLNKHERYTFIHIFMHQRIRKLRRWRRQRRVVVVVVVVAAAAVVVVVEVLETNLELAHMLKHA